MARTVGGIVPLDGPWIPDRLYQAARVIADDAWLLSSEWSERVPRSIRVFRPRRAGLGISVTISAGGERAPMAYTNEGYRGGRPVWHPVFARGDRRDWTWVPQPPRPFMRPAAEFRAAQAADVFAKAIDDWARASGFL